MKEQIPEKGVITENNQCQKLKEYEIIELSI